MEPDGSKAIETIRPGDLVLSRSEFDADGAIEAKVVEEVFVRVSPIVDLHVGGKIIGTTAGHPFYVDGKGWLACKALEIGDRVRLADGWKEVEGIADSGAVETVYNLCVEDFHTYFIGDRSFSSAVWAHNAAKTYGQFRALFKGRFNLPGQSVSWRTALSAAWTEYKRAYNSKDTPVMGTLAATRRSARKAGKFRLNNSD